MNFSEMFKKRCADIDLGVDLKPEDIVFDIQAPLPKKEAPVMKVRRYNVHKRSLPIGIDEVVFYGVSHAEAEWITTTFLKAKSYQDDARETKTLVYYDIVPVEATPRERSIYFNHGPVMQAEE